MQIRRSIHRVGVVASMVLAGYGTAAMAADEIRVADAWVRATAPGQGVAGAYMNLTSRSPVALLGAASPVAGRVELHTMSMNGGVMRMRPLDRLELPPNKTVSLTPGGHHLMLIDVKRPLKAGERVALVLTVQSPKNGKLKVHVDAEVRPLASGH